MLERDGQRSERENRLKATSGHTQPKALRIDGAYLRPRSASVREDGVEEQKARWLHDGLRGERRATKAAQLAGNQRYTREEARRRRPRLETPRSAVVGGINPTAITTRRDYWLSRRLFSLQTRMGARWRRERARRRPRRTAPSMMRSSSTDRTAKYAGVSI